MKKTVIFFLIFCISLTLFSACGSQTDDTAQAQADISVEEASAPESDSNTEIPAESSAESSDVPPEKPEESNGSDIPQEAIAAEDQVVPDHAEAAVVEIPDGATYLAFSGDQHGETPGYRVWLEDILSVYGDNLAMLNYSGDICEKNWEQETYESWKATLDELFPGKYNVTTGNQEFKSGAPGTSFNDLGEGFLINGEVAKTDNYIIYNIGASSENMLFSDDELTAISEYLAAAPSDIPIFVLSHYPLHLSVATDDHSIPG